jgi:hypothetical protein
MFEEMKKLKKHLQSEKSDTAPQQASSARAAAVTPTKRMSKCPACDRQFPIEALKKHLVHEHGVAERTSLSDAVAMLSGGKISAQHDDERQKPKLKPKLKPFVQNQSRPAHPNNKTAKKLVVRSGQQRKRVEGLDRHKNLDGYTEQVVRLPNGEDHRIFVKRTELPKHNAPVTAGRVSSNPGKKSSSGQRPGQQPARAQEKPLPLVKRSFRLSNPDEFKVPDKWVALGTKTTLQTGGRSFTVRMGIDFGTAFTKASVGYGDDIFIVDWAGIKEGAEKFTLPGEFSVLPDGSCVVGRAPGATRVATDLKLPFLEGHASRSALIDATIFLSLIMRYIRGWWFHHHKGLINTQAIEWNINLGAPTTPWQDGSIRQKYGKAAKVAWVMSCSDQAITVDQAEQIFDRAGLKSPPVEIVPEFVAQIASYTRSPQRQPDLHLLVDVGAGTVDVVTFNVHRDDETGEDLFPIFWASVSNLGTHYLMSRRLHAFPEIRDEHWSDATIVPSAGEFAQTLGIAVQDVAKTDNLHAKDVASAISSVLRTTKQNRYRRSPNWKAGVRVFFCGGGSSCEAFDQSISVASTLSGVPLPRLRLPLPSHLKAPSMPSDQFHRVSVAYGLGMDAFNLGQIRSSAEVENDSTVDLPLRPHNTNSDYRG